MKRFAIIGYVVGVIGLVLTIVSLLAPGVASAAIGRVVVPMFAIVDGNNPGRSAVVDAKGNLKVSVSDIGPINVSTNFPDVQKVAVTNYSLPVTGTVAVSNFPSVQPVSGTVNVGNIPSTQNVAGTVNVGNLPATQRVQVTNLPTAQTVNGTVAVSNFPAVQPVNGSVTVANLPSTQTVSGTVSMTPPTLTLLFSVSDTLISTDTYPSVYKRTAYVPAQGYNRFVVYVHTNMHGADPAHGGSTDTGDWELLESPDGTVSYGFAGPSATNNPDYQYFNDDGSKCALNNNDCARVDERTLWRFEGAEVYLAFQYRAVGYGHPATFQFQLYGVR